MYWWRGAWCGALLEKVISASTSGSTSSVIVAPLRHLRQDLSASAHQLTLAALGFGEDGPAFGIAVHLHGHGLSSTERGERQLNLGLVDDGDQRLVGVDAI